MLIIWNNFRDVGWKIFSPEVLETRLANGFYMMKTTAQVAKTASLILPDNLLTKFYEREYEAELIRKQKLEEEKMELEKQITDKNTNVQILSDKHSTDVYPCEECDNVFLSAESRKNHVKKIHKEKWQQIENRMVL